MNIIKNTLTSIIALSLVLSITGCSKNQNEVQFGSNSVSSVDSFEKDNEDIFNEFSFMNSKVTIPFKLKDLKNIKIDEETSFETDEGDLFCSFWFDDNYRIGTLRLENCSIDDKNKGDKNIVYLKISPDIMFDDFEFEYKGLTFSSTKEDIINTLGESEVENQLTYMLDDKTKINFKITDNTVYRVTISSNDFEE